MRGLMMNRPLQIPSLLEYAANYHGDTLVVSCTADQPVRRLTYHQLRDRTKQLANALTGEFAVGTGDRIATLAWNDHRHVELYYAVAGMGAICHTINPRLFPDQIAYIVNHAEDRWLFTDPVFLPLVEKLMPQLSTLEGVVVLSDAGHMPETGLERVRDYEGLIAGRSPDFDWPDLEEATACGLCYTSGTTGHPKGVLYDHRSTVLHAMTVALPDNMALTSRDSVLPVVPMFHVNAWGLPYACPLVGAKLVMPGPRLDGAGLYDQFEREQVTFAAGVPTIWFGLLKYLDESGHRMSSLQRVVIGGSAPPLSMIERFERDHGVEVLHGWGMTEMSPVGTVCTMTPPLAKLPMAERHQIKLKQGHPMWGVELKIVDQAGKRLPHDGKTSGILYTRGPWITSGYFRDDEESAAAFDDEEWFATGDIATIDPNGYMQITDRAKDMIKSGGEWISSIELENVAVGHPAVAEAAAIGVAHPKWDERPLLVVVRRSDGEVDEAALLDYLSDKMPKWWLPDQIVFVDELPHGATGKIQKSVLRERFKDHRLPTGPE